MPRFTCAIFHQSVSLHLNRNWIDVCSKSINHTIYSGSVKNVVRKCLQSRGVIALIISFIILIAVPGCSEGPSPTSPDVEPTQSGQGSSGSLQAQLWGYWDITIDTSTGEVTAVPDRSAMFSANVVTFLNSNPANLSFQINKIVQGADYTDIDINIGLTHPFPGLNQYDGYDVRGIFIGDGSRSLSFNGDLDRL